MVGWTTVIRTIGALGFALSIPFLSIYLNEELGISPTYIGLMFTISGVVGSSVGTIGGSLSDRYGRKKMLYQLLALRAVVFFILAYLVWHNISFVVFAIFWTVNSLLGASTFPISDAIIADVTPSNKRSEGYGILRVGANLGWALGPAIGGVIIVIGYHWLFLFTAITLVITSFLAYYKLTETFKPGKIDQKTKHTFTVIAKDHYALGFLLILLCLTLVKGQLIATLSMHASANVGLPKVEIGVVYLINAGMVTLLQVPLARYIKKYRILSLMSIAGVFYAVGYFIVGLSQEFAQLIAGVVVLTIGEMIESPSSSTYMSLLAPEGRLGAYMGGYSVVIMLGWAVGPLAGGFLLDNAPTPVGAWSGISILALVSSTGFLIMKKFEKRVEDRFATSDY